MSMRRLMRTAVDDPGMLSAPFPDPGLGDPGNADPLSASPQGDPAPDDNLAAVADALQGLSDAGRTILQAMEKFKYQVSQCARLTGPDEQLAEKIGQHVEIVDKAMSALYGVCFSLENLELTPVYDPDQVQFGDDLDYDLDADVPEPVEDEEPTEEEPADEDAEGGEEAEAGGDEGSPMAGAGAGGGGEAGAADEEPPAEEPAEEE